MSRFCIGFADVKHGRSLVLNAALVYESAARVPEGDAGKVGRHLPPRRVARHAGVAPVRAARAVAGRQRRPRRVGARPVAPPAGGHGVAGRVPGGEEGDSIGFFDLIILRQVA